MAQSIVSESKAKLIGRENEAPYIEMRVDYARAWASLGAALSKEGFHVMDQDKEEGAYFIIHKNLEEEKEEPGFFKRMYRSIFSSNKSEADQSREELRANSEYKVVVEQRADAVIVKIAMVNATDDEDDMAEERDTLRQMITLIRGNLS